MRNESTTPLHLPESLLTLLFVSHYRSLCVPRPTPRLSARQLVNQTRGIYQATPAAGERHRGAAAMTKWLYTSVANLAVCRAGLTGEAVRVLWCCGGSLGEAREE